MQAIHKKPVKILKNRTSMFFEHASMIFSSPVKWRVMFDGILGMILCSIFTAATFSCGAAFALESSANFSVVVPEVNTLEITLSDSNLVLNLTPQMAEASFGSKDLTITVGTSNIAGYNLMMNTSSTALTSAAEDTIESLDEDEDGYTCSAETCNFTLNRWGFKKSTDDAYNYIPNSVSIASNDEPTNGEDTTINFASRVDAQQPAGTYSTTLTFVATVNPTSISNISQIEHLQDFATLTSDEYENVITSMETGTAYEKPDSRDEKIYNIAKLADGNIWFLDNLRLDPSAKDLTSADTNVTATVDKAMFINKTSGWNGDSGYTQAWYNLGSETIEQSYGTGSNYIGGYYNFCAASAGSYCMDSSSGSGNAQQDLCPAGWRMPTGDASGEYTNLARAITGVSDGLMGANRTNFIEVLRASPAGDFWNSAAANQGSLGSFWSSTFYDVSQVYYLYIGAATIYPAFKINRSAGYSIRCVVKAGTEMQNLSASTVARKLANVNDVATLIDTRDYQPYSVAKLADNKIWMTKNLNLPGGTALSASDTNVSSDYISNFSTSNNLTKAGDTLILPASSTSGFSSDIMAYVYNSGSTSCDSSSPTSPCYSYYSWLAATVGSGASLTTNNVDAPYSICPRGWKLPNARSGTDDSSDFRALMIAYGGLSTLYRYSYDTSPTGAMLYSKIGPGTTANFIFSGSAYSTDFSSVGSSGYYWSSTSVYSSGSYYLGVQAATVDSGSSKSRRDGHAIRCILQ